jgi:hypothetical protein
VETERPEGGEDRCPPSLKFDPLESPYTGLLEVLSRMRAETATLDKYLAALERDARTFVAAHREAQGTAGPASPSESPSSPPSRAAAAGARSGKSWRQARP